MTNPHQHNDTAAATSATESLDLTGDKGRVDELAAQPSKAASDNQSAVKDESQAASEDESQAASEVEIESNDKPQEITEAEQLATAQNQIVRLSADIENMRRRHYQEITKAHSYGLEKCFRELMPVIDSLGSALTNTSESEQAGELFRGVELTHQLLISSLTKFGMQTIDPQVKDSFNPELHEAMTTAPSYEMPPNRVVEVIQCGYQLNDRLLRPARVIVSVTPTDS